MKIPLNINNISNFRELPNNEVTDMKPSPTLKEEKFIKVPQDIILEIIEIRRKLEGTVATLEILIDKEALQNIKKGMEDIEKGKCVRGTIDDVDKILEL